MADPNVNSDEQAISLNMKLTLVGSQSSRSKYFLEQTI